MLSQLPSLKTNTMFLESSEKISHCFERVADLRARADAETNSALKAELREYEAQWLDLLDTYRFLDKAGRYLQGMRARQLKPISAPFPSSDASLAQRLEVLVHAAIEHADGKARAAFYLADEAGTELHHVIGMTDAYAQCVNGFAIGERSLACGLAVARQQPIVTPDVNEEPRWKPWLWLAEQFRYRACWSFPIAIASSKVLGSFALYYPDRREATARDLDFASVLTRTAATIIARRGVAFSGSAGKGFAPKFAQSH